MGGGKSLNYVFYCTYYEKILVRVQLYLAARQWRQRSHQVNLVLASLDSRILFNNTNAIRSITQGKKLNHSVKKGNLVVGQTDVQRLSSCRRGSDFTFRGHSFSAGSAAAALAAAAAAAVSV